MRRRKAGSLAALLVAALLLAPGALQAEGSPGSAPPTLDSMLKVAKYATCAVGIASGLATGGLTLLGGMLFCTMVYYEEAW